MLPLNEITLTFDAASSLHIGWLPSCAFSVGEQELPPDTLFAVNFAFSLWIMLPGILLWTSTPRPSPSVFSKEEGAKDPGGGADETRAAAHRQRGVYVDRTWGHMGWAKGQ